MVNTAFHFIATINLEADLVVWPQNEQKSLELESYVAQALVTGP